MERIRPGHYRYSDRGHAVSVYRVRERGPEGGIVTYWDAQLDTGGPLGLAASSKKQAVQMVERLITWREERNDAGQ